MSGGGFNQMGRAGMGYQPGYSQGPQSFGNYALNRVGGYPNPNAGHGYAQSAADYGRQQAMGRAFGGQPAPNAWDSPFATQPMPRDPAAMQNSFSTDQGYGQPNAQMQDYMQSRLGSGSGQYGPNGPTRSMTGHSGLLNAGPQNPAATGAIAGAQPNAAPANEMAAPNAQHQNPQMQDWLAAKQAAGPGVSGLTGANMPTVQRPAPGTPSVADPAMQGQSPYSAPSLQAQDWAQSRLSQGVGGVSGMLGNAGQVATTQQPVGVPVNALGQAANTFQPWQAQQADWLRSMQARGQYGMSGLLN